MDVDDERNLPTTYIKDAAETDLLGRYECLLSEIVGSRNSTFEKNLEGNRAGRKYGRIRIVSEQLSESARTGDLLVLNMQGQALAAKDGAKGHTGSMRSNDILGPRAIESISTCLRRSCAARRADQKETSGLRLVYLASRCARTRMLRICFRAPAAHRSDRICTHAADARLPPPASAQACSARATRTSSSSARSPTAASSSSSRPRREPQREREREKEGGMEGGRERRGGHLAHEGVLPAVGRHDLPRRHHLPREHDHLLPAVPAHPVCEPGAAGPGNHKVYRHPDERYTDTPT